MTRLLFLARYRASSMHQKVELLAARHGFDVQYIYPGQWQDEFGAVRQSRQGESSTHLERMPLPVIGRVNDPHRSTYRSLALGMRRFRPDVIMAEEEPDSIAALHIALARRLFAPTAKLALYTWQNQRRQLSAAVRAVLSITLAASDAVVCANRDAVTLLREHGYAGRTSVIPAIGVDQRALYAVEQRPDIFTIGYIGRFDRAKGLRDLLDAFARLGDIDCRLRLTGDGPFRPQLMADIAQLGFGRRVEVIEPVAPAQIRQEYARLSALVLPSRTTRTWKEQFGRVLTEAMACGVPVIGSNSGAIPEVIGDAGLIFPEGDANALASLLHQLSNDAALANTLRARGLARVAEHYTQDCIAAKTAEFLAELRQA
jgi:glycosyltransferase involved in cell wall biosynthesis